MFEKKVYILNDFLQIGKKEIAWSHILGIRSISGEVIEKISPAFPWAEIFLEDGKVITVSNRNKFLINDRNVGGIKKVSTSSAILIIKKKAENTIPELNNYFEFYLIFIVAIFQISSAIAGVVMRFSMNHLFLMIFGSCLIGSIIGLSLERIRRKKIINKTKKS